MNLEVTIEMFNDINPCLISSHRPASWLRCLLPWVMVWVLSGVGAVWGCVRVLYLWEPVTPLHSPKSVSFWRHRKQADLHLNRVSTDQRWDEEEYVSGTKPGKQFGMLFI